MHARAVAAIVSADVDSVDVDTQITDSEVGMRARVRARVRAGVRVSRYPDHRLGGRG